MSTEQDKESTEYIEENTEYDEESTEYNNESTEYNEYAPNIYTLLDGLAYNTRGYFASCVVFFRAPQGRGKMRAMSKMSASIIC